MTRRRAELALAELRSASDAVAASRTMRHRRDDEQREGVRMKEMLRLHDGNDLLHVRVVAGRTAEMMTTPRRHDVNVLKSVRVTERRAMRLRRVGSGLKSANTVVMTTKRTMHHLRAVAAVKMTTHRLPDELHRVGVEDRALGRQEENRLGAKTHAAPVILDAEAVAALVAAVA